MAAGGGEGGIGAGLKSVAGSAVGRPGSASGASRAGSAPRAGATPRPASASAAGRVSRLNLAGVAAGGDGMSVGGASSRGPQTSRSQGTLATGASGSRAQSVGRSAMSGNPTVADTLQNPADEESQQEVGALTIVAPASVGGSGSSRAGSDAQSLYLIVATTAGRAVRIDVGKAISAMKQKNIVGSSRSSAAAAAAAADAEDTTPAQATGESVGGARSLLTTNMRTIFYFHVDSVEALCAECGVGVAMIATGGDDRKICVWDTIERRLLTRTTAKVPSPMCQHYTGIVFV